MTAAARGAAPVGMALPGLVIAIAVWVPLLNLFVPVLAAAAMVHVLDGIMRMRG